MRNIAVYLLATLGGNSQPKAEDLREIMGAVAISSDDLHLNNTITALNGKDLCEIIALGKAKLASVVPSGGSQAAAPISNTAASDSKPAAKKEEPKEESDDDMGFGLFD